nr:MAG TPA: hypothetical protein [Caudoviricetes sp.]DAT46302.1 MAG TPA: hypothetical protein [Caudoviricetes sp.]
MLEILLINKTISSQDIIVRNVRLYIRFNDYPI